MHRHLPRSGRRLRALPLAATLLGLLGAVPAPAQVAPVRVAVAPTHECAYIRQTSNAQASVCQNPDYVADNTGGAIKRPLMRFNIRSIPFASTITNATLRLYSTGDHGSVAVHQVLKLWTLGATWHTYDGTNLWANLGGDFPSSPVAATSVTNGWHSWDVTALANSWVTGQQPNYGLIALGEPRKTNKFSTSQRVGQAPYLDVTYVRETIRPTLDEPEHTPAPPTGWVDAMALRVKGPGDDIGTGLQPMMLRRPTPSGTATDTQFFKCDPLLSPTCNPDNETMCGGTWDSRCPLSGSKTFDYNTSTLAEGIVRPSLVVRDAAANESEPRDWELKVDHTPPTVNLDGAVHHNRCVPGTPCPVLGTTDQPYTLAVNANDPYSGVQRIEVLVDDVVKGSWDASCSSAGCPAGDTPPFTWTLNAEDYANGAHTVKVVALDQLGHRAEQSFQISTSDSVAEETRSNGAMVEMTFSRPAPTGADTVEPDTTITDHVRRLIEGAEKDAEIRIALHSIAGARGAEIKDAILAEAKDGGTGRVTVLYDRLNMQPGSVAEDLRDGLGDPDANGSFVMCNRNSDPDSNDDSGCLSSKSYSRQHAKYVLISRGQKHSGNARGTHSNIVWIGSANMTPATGWEAFNDSATIYGDAALYEGLRDEIFDVAESRSWTDNDFYGNPAGNGYVLGTNSNVTAFASPENTPDQDLVLNRLDEVDPDPTGFHQGCFVRVMQAMFGDRSGEEDRGEMIANKLVNLRYPPSSKEGAGCTVQVLVSRDPDSAGGGAHLHADVKRVLCNANIPVKSFPHVHDKGILIDAHYNGDSQKQVVFTGSHNLTDAALRNNDEILARVGDGGPVLYDEFAQHFERAYDDSTYARNVC